MTTLLLDINGTKVSITGDNLSVAIDEIHERASINDKASLEAGLQAEASPAGIGSRTLADREARSNGEAVSAVLPTNQPETATETMGGTGDDCSFGNRGVWPPQGGASSSRALNDISAEKVVTVVGSESGTVSKAKAGGDPLAPKTYVLRPNCLQPESCGGYSDHHCHACTKIMESAEETKHRIASCFKGAAA